MERVQKYLVQQMWPGGVKTVNLHQIVLFVKIVLTTQTMRVTAHGCLLKLLGIVTVEILRF